MTSDSRYIVSGSKDGSIKVFDFETKEEVHHFKDVHKGTVLIISYNAYSYLDGINSVAISPDNRYIISGSSDNTIKMFELEIDPVYHHFQESHRRILFIFSTSYLFMKRVCIGCCWNS